MAAFVQTLFEMSASAAVVILVVLLVRLLLKKAPRKYSYALWAVAAFRLVCPVSFRSVFSIFTLTDRVKLPGAGQAVPSPVITLSPDVIATAPPAVTVTPPAAVTVPPAVTVTPPAVTEPIATVVSFWDVAAAVWLVVLAGLLIYGAVSYVRLRRRMDSAVLLEGNVYRSDRVRSPFILGFIRPKIYLPFGLTEEQQCYVLAHEQYHLRRLDHLIRPLSFLILCVHWFNPLVWLAYCLMGRDMEMSCDEKVLGGADNIRRAYSITLLSFAANRRFPSPSPLAFGETGVKGRIKNVLNWKKPALWVTVIAVIAVIAVLLVCGADPAKPDSADDIYEWMSTVTAEDITRIETEAEGRSGVIYGGENEYLDPLGNQKVQVLVNRLNGVPADALKEAGDEGWRFSVTVECGKEIYILRLSDDGVGVTWGKRVWVIVDDALDTAIRNLAADALGWQLVYQWEYYETVECLYLDPASSVAFTDRWGEGTSHRISKNHIIAYAEPNTYGPHLDRMGPWETLAEERWESMFTGEHPLPYSTLSNPVIRTAGQGTRLVQTGEKLWLLDMHDGDPDKVWAVFRLEQVPEASFETPAGWYRSVECVFMNPLSSWIPMNGDSGFFYQVEGGTLTMVHNGTLPTIGDSTGYAYHHAAEGGWEELTEDMWREMTKGTFFVFDSDLWDTVGRYDRRYIRWYENGYFLLSMDGQVWVGEGSMHPNGEQYLWDLYRLEPVEEAPEVTVERLASFTADLNHDNSSEILTVTYDHSNETYKLTISESIGMNVLLEWEYHRMENLNEGFYLYSQDGKDYLLRWAPYCQQGVWHLSYEVFSFGKDGSHAVLEQGLRRYDDSHLGDSHLTADLDDLRAFEGEINALLAESVPVLVCRSSVGESTLIGGEAALWKSPADDWEARRKAEQEEASAREKATLAVWPLNDLTVTLLRADGSDDPFYTLDVFGNNNYFFWETKFHRVSHNLLYFRYEEGGVHYLMELSIGGGQGVGIWSYRVFSVLPESLEILRQNELYFDASTKEAMLTVDTAALCAFEAEVNGLLERAHLIGGVDNSKLVYNTPDSITTVYRMNTGMAELIGERQRETEQPQPTPAPVPTPEPTPQPTSPPEEVEIKVVRGGDLSRFVIREIALKSISVPGELGLAFTNVTIDPIEYFELGMAGQTAEDSLYRVTLMLEPGGEVLVFYIGFHRDWEDGLGEEYCLGAVTEEELMSRYGHMEGAARYRTALQDLFNSWREIHSCLCG